MTSTATRTSDLQSAWDAWHRDRETALATPHGWLSLTGFHWLPESAAPPSVLPGLPGRWRADAHGASVSADVGDGLTLVADGAPVEGTISATVPEAGSLGWVRHGDRLVELVLRGGRYAVRVRDPRAPTLQGFRGVPAFPVDPWWVVDGTFTPYPEPVPTEVATARADLRQEVLAVGEVSIDIAGTRHTLIATGSVQSPSIGFHDATNGDSTAPWRVVPVSPAPSGEPGAVVLDFNRAVNQPFAFSAFGTCPAPVAGNVLPVAVTAGEQLPTGPA